MSFSKAVFFLPAASVVCAIAFGSGACSSSSGDVTVPPESTPPSGVTFSGGTFGGSCSGNVYADAGVGWAFCDGGTWAYTTTDPSTDGFTKAPAGDDGGSKSEASPADDSGGGSDGGQLGGDSGGGDGGQGGDGGGQGDGGQFHQP